MAIQTLLYLRQSFIHLFGIKIIKDDFWMDWDLLSINHYISQHYPEMMSCKLLKVLAEQNGESRAGIWHFQITAFIHRPNSASDSSFDLILNTGFPKKVAFHFLACAATWLLKPSWTASDSRGLKCCLAWHISCATT